MIIYDFVPIKPIKKIINEFLGRKNMNKFSKKIGLDSEKDKLFEDVN